MSCKALAVGYIFVWLIGYSALLGPIAGIMIADYYLAGGSLRTSTRPTLNQSITNQSSFNQSSMYQSRGCTSIS
jgi:cytosine/uracil/thiamine/allantoin permease